MLGIATLAGHEKQPAHVHENDLAHFALRNWGTFTKADMASTPQCCLSIIAHLHAALRLCSFNNRQPVRELRMISGFAVASWDCDSFQGSWLPLGISRAVPEDTSWNLQGITWIGTQSALRLAPVWTLHLLATEFPEQRMTFSSFRCKAQKLAVVGFETCCFFHYTLSGATEAGGFVGLERCCLFLLHLGPQTKTVNPEQ